MSDAFVSEMVELVRDAKSSHNYDAYASSSMRFIEEVSKSSSKEMEKSMGALNQALRQDGLPEVYFSKTSTGDLKEVHLNNSFFCDTPLYSRPLLHGEKLKDPRLEKLSQHLEAVKALQANSGANYHLIIGRSDIKSAGEFLRDTAGTLTNEDRYKVLKRASDLSYKRGHSLNVVFADLDGDGKPMEVSDLAINYMHKSAVERIDIYDPPVKEPNGTMRNK